MPVREHRDGCAVLVPSHSEGAGSSQGACICGWPLSHLGCSMGDKGDCRVCTMLRPAWRGGLTHHCCRRMQCGQRRQARYLGGGASEACAAVGGNSRPFTGRLLEKSGWENCFHDAFRTWVSTDVSSADPPAMRTFMCAAALLVALAPAAFASQYSVSIVPDLAPKRALTQLPPQQVSLN